MLFLVANYQPARSYAAGGRALQMGWPADLTLYKLLTDWGSIIGGVLALIAGGAVVIIGRMQVTPRGKPQINKLPP
jgi:hypothetical protein